MISAVAGTSMSTVLHLTISTDLWRRKPAKTISTMSRGSGAVAAYVTTGSVPMATAASMRAPPCAFMSRKFSAPFLWMCQCMPVVLLSYFCKRYMPTLRLPVFGFLVKTSGKVTNGPPSSGQHLRMGISSRSGFSVSTTSWHGACLTYFGKLMARLIIGIIVTTLILFCNETYGSFIISRSSSATSSSFSTPRAMAMRS